MAYDGILPTNNIMVGFNFPPRSLQQIGAFKTGSEWLIGSSSNYEFWFQDKIAISGSEPVISSSEGTQDGYGNYNQWTASISNKIYADSVTLKGDVQSDQNLLRFYTSQSFYFPPGKYTFEANIYGKNPDGVPTNFPGTSLFVYISGSAFTPKALDNDFDYYSGIEVPSKENWGQPIASFNPQYRNGKIRKNK